MIASLDESLRIAEVFQLVVTCGLPLALVLLGLGAGRVVERAHLRRIEAREAATRNVFVSDVRTAPPGIAAGGATLVTGSVVIGSDPFKRFVGALRSIVGGEMRAYNRMMQRARREAILRAVEEAQRLGATAVINLRLETSNVGGIGKKAQIMAEVMAYGTAIVPR